MNPKAIKMRRPLVQNRNEENGRSPFSEWRFPLVRPCRVSESKWAGRPAGLFVGQSVSQSVSVCVQATFVNSSGSAKPIRTGPTPKDAPKRRNDDGDGHVAPRATCEAPRAAAWTLRKIFYHGCSPNGGSPGAQTFRPERPWSDLSAMGSKCPEGAKVRPQGALLHFRFLPSSSDTL